MSQISCNKPVLMLLVLLTAASCCKKDKETVVEKNKIVMGAPTISGTKAAINSLNDLKASGLEIGVYGYKTQPIDQTLNFYRLFNNTPVEYTTNDQIWSYNPTRYWDSNPVVTYQFFAYWPHLGSSDPGDGSPWVEANDVNNLTSTDDMRVTLHSIPNWQDVADTDTRDYLTSVRPGQYRSNVEQNPLFYGGTVNFNFSHILSKLIIRGYYVGDQNNQVKVHNITISGDGILSASGTSTYQSTIALESFTQVSKASAQQTVELELYDNAQGCLIQQNAFKENDNDDQYIPTPVCEWLVVPTNGWTGLSLSVTYAIGSAQQQTSEIENTVELGSGQNHQMVSGNTYILDLKFNTQGGIELKTMLISEWIDENVSREVYNW